MICKTCGRELPDNYAFCSYCGTDLRMINVNQAPQAPVAEPAAPAFPVEEQTAPAFPVEETPEVAPEPAMTEEPEAPAFPVEEQTAPAFPVEETPEVAPEPAIAEGPAAPDSTGLAMESMDASDPDVAQESVVPEIAPAPEQVAHDASEEIPQEVPQEPEAPAFPVNEAPPLPMVEEPFNAVASQEPQQNTMSSDIPVFDQASIPQNEEIDPEAGTTVLTAGMSGPLTAEMNNAKPKYEKVVTPAPVTNSNILSDSGVLPVTPTVQAQNYYGGVQNNAYTAPPMNNNMQNSYPVNNQMNNQNNGDLITPWGYVGYSLLFCIPILGLVMLFVYGFGEGHSQNLKNFARGQLLMIAIAIAIELIVFILMAILGVSLFSALR